MLIFVVSELLQSLTFCKKEDATSPSQGITHNPPPVITEIGNDKKVVIRTVDELISANRVAKIDDTIYIHDSSVIDLTNYKPITIKAGVKLVSGRGQKGSMGGLLVKSGYENGPIFISGGENILFLGLRIKGPNPTTEKSRNATGISVNHNYVEVRYCELAGWPYAAIEFSHSNNGRVNNCLIHHNQKNGLGYGIVIVSASVIIDHNVFDYNRHAIAATGNPNDSYEAYNNIILGHGNGHSFDMHGMNINGNVLGGRDIKIYNNEFRNPSERAVMIRGVPTGTCEILDNKVRSIRASLRPTIYFVYPVLSARVQNNVTQDEFPPIENPIFQPSINF
ncbi:right-handed parallel beta-helix repeat-containing protein [Solitalea lacus]|uniref:right-handed parallel beta-helix repeat-containing protein n=1 Tax=Solitalea lacus TaxID=2911172 RepID=UPI001EDAAA18|nr:right-handed parallel beta-helix repeat-containing protein [Solitalea lacus]UKJ07653.1 right-handed parallel beta-helix repeat-containing protein [Solitalea lacus]